MANSYRIFISHRWNYADFAIELKQKLDSRSYFPVEYDEVGKHDPIDSVNTDYIKRKVRRLISECGVFVVDSSPSSSNSEWIKWEIATAKKLGVAVIGILPPGYTNQSSLVQAEADVLCGWGTEKIVDTIRAYGRPLD